MSVISRKLLAILTSLPVVFGTLIFQTPAQASSYTFDFFSKFDSVTAKANAFPDPNKKFIVEISRLNTSQSVGMTCEILDEALTQAAMGQQGWGPVEPSCDIGSLSKGDEVELEVFLYDGGTKTKIASSAVPVWVGFTFDVFSPSATALKISTDFSPQPNEKYEVEITELNRSTPTSKVSCEILQFSLQPDSECRIDSLNLGDEVKLKISLDQGSSKIIFLTSEPHVVGKPLSPYVGQVGTTQNSITVSAVSGPDRMAPFPSYASDVVKPTHFEITPIDSDGNRGSAQKCTATTAGSDVGCSLAFNGLTAGDTWKFELVAIVESGSNSVESEPAVSRLFTVGAPDKPQMTPTAGNSSIAINLSPGADTSFEPPTSYKVVYYEPGQPSFTAQCTNLDESGACSLELTGLQNFAMYRLEAYALNSNGQSFEPARGDGTPTLELVSQDLHCGNGAANDAIYLFYDQALEMNLKAAENCAGFRLDTSNAGSDWKKVQSGGGGGDYGAAAFGAMYGGDPSETVYLLADGVNQASLVTTSTQLNFAAETSGLDFSSSWVAVDSNSDGSDDAVKVSANWNLPNDPAPMPDFEVIIALSIISDGYAQPDNFQCRVPRGQIDCILESINVAGTKVALDKPPFSNDSVQLNVVNPDGRFEPKYMPDRQFKVDVFWTPHLLSTSRLDVQSTANGEVVLEWDAPLESGAGSGLKEYELTYTLSGGSPATQTCAGNTISTSGNTEVVTCTISGLTVDGEYDFELRTVDTVDRKSATPATITAFAIAPPGAPTITSATRGDESVTLSVAADATSGVGQPSDYLITATPTAGGAAVGPVTCAYASATATTSCNLPGLTNGTEYSFTAEAINNSAPAGSGFVSSAVTATPATTPGLISGLTATPGNTQMVLAWTAPTGDGGDTITDYKVEYQTSSGGTWTLFSDGTSSTPGATVTGLTNGTSYDFRVSAINSVGDGPTAAITAAPATTPGAISGLTSTEGNSQVILSWSAPSNTGGSPITDYKVEYSADGNTWNLFNDGVSASTGATVTGLTNGTNYTFRVFAINAVGTALTPVSTSAKPATLPGAISGLTATAGNNRVTLSWSAPTTGGSVITDYEVEYSTDGTTWSIFNDGVSDATSAVVTGLTNNTAYSFRVFAINGVGAQTTSSNIASATPAVPVGPPGTPSLTNVVSGDGKLTVAVGEGTGSTPTSYDITATPVGGGTAIGPVNCIHAGDPTSCDVTGLVNGVSYTLTAIAKNSSGNSSVTPVPTSPVAPVALPGVPSVVAINGDGQATLNITAGTPGGAPTLYEISSTPTLTIPDCNVTLNVNPTVCVVTGLTNGTAYTFTARAKNSSGQSASPSAASNSISPIALPAAPSISGVVAGNGKATITVTAPVSGGPADDFEVSVVGDSSKKCTISASASPLSCEITGLTNGVNYQFEATASNSAGASLQASAAVGPAAAAPLTPSVSAVTGNGQATLTLTSGSIGEVTSYDVDVISGGQTVATVSCPATAGTAPTTCVVPNLTNDTAYTFEAVANNGAGTSAASSPSNQITPVAPAPPAANNTPTAPSVPSLPTVPGASQTPAPAVNTSLMPVGNQAAAATVGGQTQPVTVSPASPAVCVQSTSCPVPAGAISNGTSVTVGSTQLSVSGPSMGGSVSNGATTVMPGQPVRIAAGGLAPNSQAAVFALPLGTALATLFVGSDGKLSAAPRLGQLPANTTAIQITGTTADGPIALSIRVVVANAPEPARTTNQVLPETKPGSALVLVDGGASQYSPERLERSLLVEAEGTRLALGVIEGSELAPIRESGDLSVEKTQWLNLTGSGYSEYVDVFLFSEPVFLGRVLVGADGSFIGSLQMPTSVTAGWHTLQTVGKNGEGVEVAASFAIEVLQAEPARFWTRATAEGVKLYGINVIGAGKIQFFQNGREVAWVTAVDGDDAKLRLISEGPNAGRDYFVRTRQPIAGRNTFEVFVDGERVLRRIFTLRD